MIKCHGRGENPDLSVRFSGQMGAAMERLQSKPVVSGLLVGINVLVFIICMFTGNLLYGAGRMSAYDVLTKGEYARILWAMFLHSDISHIFNNMVILFFLGAMIEKEVGHVRYCILYFLSGIGGNLLSLLAKVMSEDPSGSIGASGAVFGLDGVLLAMVLFSDRKMENVTPVRVLIMIAYSLYSGFAGENIDNAAHVGGLLTGFTAAAVMCAIQRIKGRRRDMRF